MAQEGGGANICPEPVMEMVINKTRLDEERARCGVKCNLYEARMKVTHSKTDEQNLKIELSKINPNMGFSQMLVDEDEARPTVQTKFGNCVVGSYLSYQVGFTESNFKATVNIHCIPRLSVPNKENELNYPRFPMRNFCDSDMVVPTTISDDERNVISKLIVSEDDINKIEIETRKQSECDKWKEERKLRFTASKFDLISKRRRNHNTYAESLINPKNITSRALSHGKKFESVALMQYHKVMHKRRTPVHSSFTSWFCYKQRVSYPWCFSRCTSC